MRKILFLLLLATTIISCKKDTKNNQESTTNNLVTLNGEFVYFDDAAVLQTNTDIYGVLVNDKLLELNKQAEQYKKEPTDMVKVQVQAIITNKKDDKILWENKAEITEIISVTSASPNASNLIKLEQ